ncbi:hypothetical protein N9W10_03125 [Gammaproteobacteria bacterium]|nr:hypothetical protein [Gammaproteobacteria bacterium]
MGNRKGLSIPRYYLDAAVITLFLILFAFQSPYTLLSCYSLAAIYVLFRWEYISIRRSIFTYYLWMACLFLPALSLFNHGITPYIYLLLFPVLVIFASLYAKQPINAIKSSLSYSFWVLIILTLSAVLKNGFSATPLEQLIPGTSTNGIPSYFIVLFVALAISSLISEGRMPVVASIATFIIAILGVGRGSIIVAAILLLFSLSFAFFSSKIRPGYKLSLVLLAVLLAIIYIANNFIEILIMFETVLEGSKFANGIWDEHRAKIIMEYIAKIDVLPFILGADYIGTSILDFYDGNPHNSYIRVHAFYGLWGVLCIFIPLILLAFKDVNWHLKLSIFFLIGCALLRATSEPIFFPSLLDFFYLLYFFMFHYNYPSFKISKA